MISNRPPIALVLLSRGEATLASDEGLNPKDTDQGETSSKVLYADQGSVRRCEHDSFDAVLSRALSLFVYDLVCV